MGRLEKTSLLVLTLVFWDLGWAKNTRPLSRESYQKIIDNYLFVEDFTIKPETRPLKEGVFWRYQIKIPKPEFRIDFGDSRPNSLAKEFPPTQGVGRAIEHINRGRTLFLEGNLKGAKKTLLSARARYGTDYTFHRRTDFYLANVFLQLAKQKSEGLTGEARKRIAKASLSNAATFLSWAYLRKKALKDEVLDVVAPKNYYNLAVIYYNYSRFGGAFGAASDGLEFLSRSGRSDYRARLRHILAEMSLINQDYLSAVQDFDAIIRQDADQSLAGVMFSRVADIYFNLNNFELAEDIYSLANRVDFLSNQIKPYQFILRGESLFWLGKYDEAQKMLHYGIQGSNFKNAVAPLGRDLAALASIRIADAWLAKGNYEKAKLQYFRHFMRFRGHETERYAKLRGACLELPYYQGNNIKHARSLLSSLRKRADRLPPVARELAWSCEVASYAQHERTFSMVERVRNFAREFPNSKFLASLVEPVRESQAKRLYTFFEKNDSHGAIDFFEKTRSMLFKNIDKDTKSKLFSAYMDVYDAEKAFEFWSPENVNSQLGRIRYATFLAEYYGKNSEETWLVKNKDFGQSLADKTWSIKPTKRARLYVARILASKVATYHLSWVIKLTETWASGDFIEVCNIAFPILSEAWRNPEISEDMKGFIRDRVLKLQNKYLEEVFKFESQCAYSLLSFEFELFRNSPGIFAKSLIERSYLPVNRQTAGIYWGVAELLRSTQKVAQAKEVFEYIIEKGDANLAEVKYSKNRLEVFKTEFDSLWK